MLRTERSFSASMGEYLKFQSGRACRGGEEHRRGKINRTERPDAERMEPGQRNN